MRGCSPLLFIACVSLLADVPNASPLVLPALGRLPSTINQGNSSSPLYDDSSTTFPPFPPPTPFILHVGGPDQWHDVLLSIRWHESKVKPRNETATREVVVLAMADVLAHAAMHNHYIPPNYKMLYEVKDVVLQRYDRTTYFTWDLWEIVLTGVEQFIEAYDGLYFKFDIYLGEKKIQQHIGAGALSGP